MRGAVTLARSYEPFGNTLSSVGSGTTVFQFTGEMRDATGLTYLRSRYLSTSTGRFLSRDSWAGNYQQPLTLNKWNYVESDPINRVDPRGDYDCATATVQSGDRMWRIWYDYARSHGFATPEQFYAANPQIQNPSFIFPGNKVYVPGYCPPTTSTTPPPLTLDRPYHFDNATGYLEGFSGTAIAAGFVLEATGREQVYDFVTLERSEYTIKGVKRIGKLACGLATSLGAIGVSWYVGIYHFPTDPSVTFAQPAPESLNQIGFCTARSEARNLSGGGIARDYFRIGLAVDQHPTWDAGRLR